jgi:hypothetical protein
MEQQSAYDRLYRWVKDEFATLRDDPSEINPFLIVAVSTLQEKQPVLLRCTLSRLILASAFTSPIVLWRVCVCVCWRVLACVGVCWRVA